MTVHPKPVAARPIGLFSGVSTTLGLMCHILLLGACGTGGSRNMSAAWPEARAVLDSITSTPLGLVLSSWSMMRGADGRTVMIHETSLTVFGDDGSVLAQAGGAGAGPGEFRVISHSGRISPSQFWLFDSRLQRLTQFDLHTLELSIGDARTGHREIRSRLVELIAVAGVDHDGATVMYGQRVAGDAFGGGGVVDAPESIMARWPVADAPPSLLAVKRLPTDCFENRSGRRHAIPECRRGAWDTSPGGAFIAVAQPCDRTSTDDCFAFDLIRSTGDTAASFEVDLVGSPITDSIRAEWLAVRRARERDVRWEDVTRLERVDPVRAIMVGDDGSIWVRGILRGPNRLWQVISPTGSPIAAFELDDEVWLSDPSEDGSLASRDLPNGQIVLYHLRLDLKD